MKRFKPIVLIILDGWGLSPSWGGNALMMNNPKNISALWRNYPHTILQALGAIEYGNVVGESRLGHLMIGAGRPVSGNHSRITAQIKNRKFFKNQILIEAFNWAKKHNSNIHLVGTISNGGVHADIDHLLALLDLAEIQDFKRVYIDAITDGTDSGPTDSLKFIEKIQNKINTLKFGEFASVIGRNLAMDRDEHWDKIKRYFDLLVFAKGEKFSTISEAISANYRKGKNDEFIAPSLIRLKNGKFSVIKENDAVIFFNFREDRARELTRVFTDPKFHIFLWQPEVPKNLYFATFTSYQKNLPSKVCFPDTHYADTLSEVLAKTNFKQLKVAESEKAAHVTYFFNGGIEEPFFGEERKIISSPNVTSYDKKPEMSAREITNAVVRAIKSDKYDFILVNFANIDMIAHTGNILAVGEAVKVIDEEIQKIVNGNLKNKGVTIITADHGNAEQMVSINQKIFNERETLHTLNPVPFILITPDNKKNLLRTALSYELNALSEIMSARDTLADVAPTILELMGLPKPKEMTGHSLITRLG
ncbi:phosphoglycerate mutase (2,3-diphosphoglycerate-independent) [Candidatus Berkelbacteria bacterium RBG_13_40_8]|uniref:2,3-bisphosphoglycerate-independent phosphoglycerate mutase n=1 Tax=Candidatus Berkelbacteria bacterium RBG_13_40_8 TaxID=1797467 RepID=A0A1F5DQ62_9BACT|nr:MAG: phosphoglycerate mutase (2,3-diphosphoglycerate-independent) [Candidatus Berkelbacteria bacterium RBG_13_40_8]